MKRREFSKMAAAGFLGMGLSPSIVAGTNTSLSKDNKSNNVIDIGSRLELFLDDLMVDRLEGEAQRVFHKPVPREIIMTFDKPWEGQCSVPTIFQDGDLYRMFIGCRIMQNYDSKEPPGRARTRVMTQCHAIYFESHDGIRWTRPNLGLVEYDGSKNNNILLDPSDGCGIVPFRDENPDVAPEALYKAMKGIFLPGQKYMIPTQSSDGFHWKITQDEAIISDGAFDSQNTAFWDPNINAYRAYYRIIGSMSTKVKGRDMKTATSPDYLNWVEGTPLTYLTPPPSEFYHNGIRNYHRAPHIYIGMAGAYFDRGWTPALEQLPDLEVRKNLSSARHRAGSALTDTLLIWSRDGLVFDLAPSTFLRPGPERPGSWKYSDHHVGWHLVETKSAMEGADPELSIYATESYRIKSLEPPHRSMPSKLRRYTLRLDGFASICAPINGGEVITRP